MVYNSLTEVPRNLKEGIDWLMAVKGTDAETNLKAMGEAIYNFLVDKPLGLKKLPALENVKKISKEFMGQKELKNHPSVSTLLDRFDQPMNKSKTAVFFKFPWVRHESDYENILKSQGLKPDDMVNEVAHVMDGCEKFLEKIKVPGQYKSVYSGEATWESSCAKNPEACAVVLVGIAPMLYSGLRSLKDATEAATRYGKIPKAEKRLGSLLKAVGYDEPECRPGMSGSDILKALDGVDVDILITLYDIAGFWAFY
ncbi:hypothetical protein, conserved [Babesia ovata]|uniref:Uncharacterized protein n=1 Tax=Babesia ovata TaxID=189622 RepID=A0A2H6KBD9_9APIC|nr:uncharacterized protein BOVATA_017990 [Babesia ovata]GBE60306.1 hypothetical protein, conserved [Babesia ovata]